MSDLIKDEGSCGQRIANMICVLPKGHSGLHDDLDDAASNRMRLIDAEQELVAKNNRIAALERENAELKKDVQLYRDLCRAAQSDHERVALENKSLRRLPHEPKKEHAAPIVKLVVSEHAGPGFSTHHKLHATFYAPGLPTGEYDLYLGANQSLETREQPRRHFSRNKFDRHLCDTCGADYELHEKDEMGNWCPSNTKGGA